MVDIRTVAETASTNEDMKAFVLDGAAEGTWLRAERQTGGRGRMGRRWEGEEGNFYASTLVRLSQRDPAAATLAFVAAIAVHEVLIDFTGEGALTLKWPNDIMAGQAKLCGMLLERVGDAVIIGIGINVANAPEIPGRQTASLRRLGIDSADPAVLLDLIAGCFAAWLHRWRSFGIEPVIKAWLARAHGRGTPLAVELPDGEVVRGQFETLDPGGALILRLADGSRRAIHAGDVFLL
ncbi:MAG: biotin--[acetyl-CoA-carboxylase] ligase [Sphingobium sp.]